MSSATTPNVFIIESNELADEEQYNEGQALCTILRMIGREPIYRYIRTTKELRAMMYEFSETRYRYLHISCHGNKLGSAFELSLDSVPFREFASIASPYLTDRRLFLSACNIAQPELASALYASYGSAPYSITGPNKVVHFADAAVIWASLYNLLFREGVDAIKGEHIRKYLNELCRLNAASFVHFGRTRKAPYFKRYQFPSKAPR